MNENELTANEKARLEAGLPPLKARQAKRRQRFSTVAFEVTVEQKAELLKKAKAQGISVSELCRQALFDEDSDLV